MPSLSRGRTTIPLGDPASNRLVPDADPATLSAVLIREIDPPKEDEAIEWYLLTSLPVRSVSDEEQVLDNT